MKVYHLHDPKGKFVCAFTTLENARKSAEVWYGAGATLGIISAYQTEDGKNVVNVEVIKPAKNSTFH